MLLHRNSARASFNNKEEIDLWTWLVVRPSASLIWHSKETSLFPPNDTPLYGLARPIRFPLWGLPVAVSVKEIVPARLTPLAAVTLVNRTVTVQLAPGESTTPVQLSGPASAPTLKKYVVSVPPDTVMLLTVVDVPPAAWVLVNVTSAVPVADPVGNVIVCGFGAIETVARAETPVPLSVTDAGVTVAPV